MVLCTQFYGGLRNSLSTFYLLHTNFTFCIEAFKKYIFKNYISITH